MDTFNVIAGVIGLVSLVFAVWVYSEDRKRRLRVTASVELLKERIRGAESSIRAAGTNVEILIRATDPDRSPVDSRSLALMARGIRTDIYAAGLTLKETWESLSEWRFGNLLESTRNDPEA